MLKFQNKTVLVTGSGTGIGQAITKKFVENGASAIVLGRRKGPLEETAKMLEEIIKEKQSNATVKIFDGVDVSDEKEQYIQLVQLEKRFLIKKHTRVF